MFSLFRNPRAFRLFAVCLGLGFSVGWLPGEAQVQPRVIAPGAVPPVMVPIPQPFPGHLDRSKPPAGACKEKSWVAVAEGSECPIVDGWQERPLFQRDDLPSLPRFCAYEWKKHDAAPADADFSRLRAVSVLHGTVPRCNVVSAAGQTLPETNREVMFRELRFQVGDTDLPFLTSPPGVQLSILDTYPTGNFSTAPNANCSSGHGHAIARIAQELTCDGTAGTFHDCAATITARLALPEKTQSTDACGRYGSPTDLATAILAEVLGWKPDVTPHLILNLSVGWDSKLLHKIPLAEGPDLLNAEELAVYYALGYAARQGALAIAAAGNGHGGPQPGTGPLLPAGWYASPPYTEKIKFPASPDPVVWPIGAVDRHGYRLGNSRPGAEPPLVAYGDHAVVQFGANLWTEPLTGSSVAAVVASSFAAIVWNLQPNLLANQVMALLERSGAALGRDAEFHRPAGPADEQNDSQFNQRRMRPFPSSAPPPSVRRLQLNSVLSRAWSAPEVAIRDPQFNSTVLNCAPVHQFAQSSTSVDFACDRAYSSLLPTAPSSLTSLVNPSVQLQPLAEVPWVQTQPEANACPSCALGGGGGGTSNRMDGTNPSPRPNSIELLLEIPATWGPTASLTNLWLEAEGPPGQIRRVFIGGEIHPTGTLRIINLPLRPETETARLSGSVEVDGKTFSLRMPIYVDPEK